MSEVSAESLLQKALSERGKRASDMPTEADALSVMFQAYQRLRELGWREAVYCPNDGSIFNAIEAGSTGIHDCSYEGEWPGGRWWLYGDGDIWPSRPILFKEKENEATTKGRMK